MYEALSTERIQYFPFPHICLVSNEMFPSQSAPKVLFDPNKETIFIIALDKTHVIGGKSSMAEWEAKHRFCIFGIIIPSWLSKIIQRVCNMVFHILWEFRVQMWKITKRKQKPPLLTLVSLSFINPISNGIFPSQSAPKVLLDPYKEIIVIIELYKLHKIWRKSTRSSLGSKIQTLYFWNNYSKHALKNYMGVLQHGLPHSLWISCPNVKNH